MPADTLNKAKRNKIRPVMFVLTGRFCFIQHSIGMLCINVLMEVLYVEICNRVSEMRKSYGNLDRRFPWNRKNTKINCICGYEINVSAEKMRSKVCPHCGNNVVYDQSKGEDSVCPVCHEHINTRESFLNVVILLILQ